MNADSMAPVALDTNELRKLSELPAEIALQQAAPLLGNLVKDPAFLEAEILPLLEEAMASEHGDQDPRPFLLGGLLRCCGIRTRRALRAPG